MNYQEYAPLAIRTAKFIDPATDLFHAKVGIVTEIGEICDAFKRHIVYDKPLDLTNLKEEIGDVFWYMNLLVHVTQTKPMKAFDFARYDGMPMVGKELQGFLLRLSESTGSVANGALSFRFLQKELEILCMSFGIGLGDCLTININKLAARYGDKYSDYAALNRDLTTERAVLDGSAA